MTASTTLPVTVQPSGSGNGNVSRQFGDAAGRFGVVAMEDLEGDGRLHAVAVPDHRQFVDRKAAVPAGCCGEDARKHAAVDRESCHDCACHRLALRVHDFAGKRSLFAAESNCRPRDFATESERRRTDRPIRINGEDVVFEAIEAIHVARRDEIREIEFALRVGGGLADLDDGQRASGGFKQQHAHAGDKRAVGLVDAVAVDFVARRSRVALCSVSQFSRAQDGCSFAAIGDSSAAEIWRRRVDDCKRRNNQSG